MCKIGLLRWVLVRILLLKTFTKMLARQVYVKLFKFTRRSRGPEAFYRKFAAGFDFLMSMLKYDRKVIECARRCLTRLAAEDVQEALVFGDKGVTEILYDLAFEIPVKLKTVYEHYEADEDLMQNMVPIEMCGGSRQKVIVASLVNIEERVRRLRELGVDNERMIFLNCG